METDIALTDYSASKERVERVLALPKITLKDIEEFTQMERDYLGEIATGTLNSLKGEERDNFIEKIEAIVPANTKKEFWENNHFLISRAINKLMGENGYMPSKSAIAKETGLSRQTVTKHLKEYKAHPEYSTESEQFEFMTSKVLANVFKVATNGDMRASRLYFEMVGVLNKRPPARVVNEQNNYIQVNNTILSQENLKQLSAEQLDQIELIVTGKTMKLVQ